MRGGMVMCESAIGALTLKAHLEYLQIIEAGEAADALRDSAGELVVVEDPAACSAQWVRES